MAYSFSVNNTPATAPIAVYALITLLLAKGWTKPKDSDGTTYSSAGTQVTSGAAGAGGLANNSAWFLLKHPSTNRTFCFQRGTTNLNWRVSYCADNAFTSGTPGATRISAPAGGSVEVILIGGGTDAAPTFAATFTTDNTYRFHAIAGGASEGYAWVCWCATNATGVTTSPSFYDPMVTGSYQAADLDPVVVGIGGASSTFASFLNGDASFPRAFIGALSSSSNAVGIGARNYGFGGGTNIGANPFSGKDDLSPVPWVRTTATSCVKGYSTLFRWPSVARTNMDSQSIASAGAKDAVYVNGMTLPWSGATPSV